jgi:K+-sensing histidine kinase KdpD
MFISPISVIFAGMLLGHRFKVFALLPTTIGTLFIIAMGMADPDDLWSIILVAALVTIALQIGYQIGAFIAARMAGSPRHGSDFVLPLLVCLAAIGLTTVALSVVDALMNVKHLVMGYLLPATVIAIYYGSSIAVITSFAGGVMATYFLLPPKFSFQIVDSLTIAELGFFMLLALIASKAVAAVAHDR